MNGKKAKQIRRAISKGVTSKDSSYEIISTTDIEPVMSHELSPRGELRPRAAAITVSQVRLDTNSFKRLCKILKRLKGDS